MDSNSIIKRFALKFPIQTLNHLINDGLIDKEIYLEYESLFTRLKIALPYHFKKSINWGTKRIIEENNSVSTLSYDNINQFISKKNWSVLFKSDNILWDQSLITQYKDSIYWGSSISSTESSISSASNVLWSEELINEFFDRFNLELLSRNKSIVWSDKILNRLKFNNANSEWNKEGYLPNNSVVFHNVWSNLSGNSSIKWTDELISKYYDFINFYSLSSNENVEWSIRLIDKYIDNWDWENLSGNPSLPWSIALLLRYKERLYWRRDHKRIESKKNNSISTNSGIRWSVNQFILFESLINPFDIARFASVDVSVLYRFFQRFNVVGPTGYKHIKYSSDHWDVIQVFETSWSVLAKNPNFEYTYELLNFLSAQESPSLESVSSDGASSIDNHGIVNSLEGLSQCRIRDEDILLVINSKLINNFTNIEKRTRVASRCSFFNQSIWVNVKNYFENYSNLKDYLDNLMTVDYSLPHPSAG